MREWPDPNRAKCGAQFDRIHDWIMPVASSRGLTGCFTLSLHFRRNRSAAENLVDGPVRQRYDEQVAVRAGHDVGHDAELAPNEQRLALGDVVLGEVVGDSVVETRVVDRDAPPVSG